MHPISFLRFCRRAVPISAVSLFLGGCNARNPKPVVNSAPATEAEPMPRVVRTPRPNKRPPARIFYGVSTKQRVIALTFDDGPDPTWTPQVLSILQKKRVAATFFMVGQMVRAHPRFARQVQAAKFPIGSHSWSHPRHPRSPKAEIERTDAIMQRVLGFKPTLFRPPYGIMNNGLVKVALSRDQNVIIWDSFGADWDKHATSATIAAKVLKSARPGGIVLLHDGGGHRAKTVAALPHIIDTLRKRGFRFVTVPRILSMGPPIAVPVASAARLKHFKNSKTAG